MADLRIKINLDNAAFEDRVDAELEPIFARMCLQIEAGSKGGRIMDSNGNAVGAWRISGREVK